ncbi:hypothetical protein AAHN93_14750 [Vandammella animalimorsus]|uniref:hypothetical protein n=1 Tax=Vandammella animalimorsus TaxID=2029117 RepID=UPI0031B9D4C4
MQLRPGAAAPEPVTLPPAPPEPPAPPPPPPPPPPPAEGCGCDVHGAGWLVSGGGELSEQLPNGQTRFYSQWGDAESRWTGMPAHHDADGNPLPIPAEQFHCHYIKAYYSSAEYGLHAVLQGRALADAHWTFQWQGGALGEPVAPSNYYSGTFRVNTWGNVLQVIGKEISYDGSEITISLTAWAHCGGQQVAEIALDLYFPGY